MIRSGYNTITGHGEYFEEQFVDFKIAKLLKEKGFNEHCDHFFDKDGKLYGAFPIFQNSRTPCSKLGYATCHPKLAIRWLMEKHHCSITIDTRNASDTEFNAFILKCLKGLKNQSLTDAIL